MSNTERRIAERRVEQIPGDPYRRMRIRRKCDQEATLRDLAVPAVEASGTPTPRTDAEAMRFCGNTDDDGEGQAAVGIRFARTLESELSRLTRELEEARKLMDGFIDILDDGRNNAPDERCYAADAMTNVVSDIRAYLNRSGGGGEG